MIIYICYTSKLDKQLLIKSLFNFSQCWQLHHDLDSGPDTDANAVVLAMTVTSCLSSYIGNTSESNKQLSIDSFFSFIK